ncbi:MAG: imelysin family protein [Planctomycetota bacterium]
MPALLSRPGVVLLVAVALVAGLIAVACDRAGDAPADRATLRRQVLASLARDLAAPRARALAGSAAAFTASCDDLVENEDVTRLEAARSAWRALRADWRRFEPFLIGPAATGLFAERLDAKLDAAGLRTAITAADADAVARLGAGTKGFAAQSRLLFGEEPGADECRFLALVARETEAELRALAALWDAKDGALGAALAGSRSDGPFADDVEARDALVKQAVVLAIRLRDQGLAPLVGATSGGVVRRFPSDFDPARRHRADLVASYEGLRDLMRGAPDVEGARGLLALVEVASPRVAAAVRGALDRAVSRMEALPEDLSAAMGQEDPALTAAYDASTLVKAQLGTSVVGVLETTLGFALADGD